MRIAFYTPTLAQESDTPSGDRGMAGLLAQALRAGGHEAVLASALRSYVKDGSAAGLAALQAKAAIERDRLLAQAKRDGPPDLWLTYHPYYKAPDLIGPPLCDAWSIPYATVEASFAAKRATGVWQAFHQASLEALRMKEARHFAFTGRDREGLEAFGVAADRIVDLPPFIDAAILPTPKQKQRQPSSRCVLMAVAMMRGGRKLDSFRHLARVLDRLGDLDWRLTLIGDGPQRAAVEEAMSALPSGRVLFAGRLQPEAVFEALGQADLFLWPGLGEAYGLAYLEAQAMGVPVAAYDSGGVSACVRHDDTGLLVPEGDVAALAAAVRRLIAEPKLRARLGKAGYDMVRRERHVARAADILNQAFAAWLHR